jgi:signal transduction histidine kinase
MKRRWLFTWRGLTRSIGPRFALTVFCLQIVTIVGVGVYAEREMWSRFERHEIVPVRRLRDSVMVQYQVAGIDGLKAYIKTRVSPSYTHDIAIVLAAPDGRILAGNLQHWPSHLAGDAIWSTGEVKVQGTNQAQYMGLTTTELDDGYRLLTGTAIISEDVLVRAYTKMMIVSAAIAAGISVLIAWLAALLIARRLNGVIDVATRAGEGDFSARAPISGSGDRFDDLMKWINQAMASVETLVGELRLVSGGLAHDLRSPITRLRVTLEQGLQNANDPAAVAVMNKMMSETDALLKMLAMTLQISNAEAYTNRERFTATDVRLLLNDLAEIYGPLAEQRGFAITVVAVDGMTKLLHRELCGQALSNLIENALSYADGGQNLVLSATHQDDTLTISVADDGVGIPVHRYDDAKRRYGRLDSARQLPGSGLGLSLVESVARLHGGRLVLRDNAPGLIAAMTFPAKKP